MYALDGEAQMAVVSTADFITPPFDDPQGYGRIAAANAISDVYAMGGRPICALNLCLFPRELSAEVAKEILAGARAVLAEAGAALVGGHTVRCAELFFGLSVTGLVDPGRIWRNVGAQPGDALLITKPLGCGLIVTGARRGLVPETERLACAAQMAATNRRSAETLRPFGVHAATDVTGFGLIGHALGMARDVALELELAALPLYAGAHALAAAGGDLRRSARQPGRLSRSRAARGSALNRGRGAALRSADLRRSAGCAAGRRVRCGAARSG